jgi:multidrug resistance efflux pump
MSDTQNEELSIREQLNTEEIHEIINYRPNWVVRKGISMLFILLLAALTLTWFIKYPDIVVGSIRLATFSAPKQVNARSEGRLEKLLVKNEQIVAKGQPLAYLQSTANHEQVINLQTWINELVRLNEEERIQKIISIPIPAFFSLGDLQPAYQQFQDRLIDINEVLANGYFDHKNNLLKKELEHLSNLQINSQSQLKLIQQDFDLQKQEFKAKESLLKDKIIAPLEFNQDKSKLIAKEQNLQQAQAQVINIRLSCQAKLKEIADLQKTILDTKQQFKSTLFDLKSSIEAWMLQHVMIASESGKVLFASALEENQLLMANQEMFYIQSLESGYYGELMTSQKGLGKVKTGQRVIIKIESYPAAEFGFITGLVDYISSIPNRRDSFIVKVNLPQGLRTNFGQDMYFRNSLSGSGEIVTNDRRLLQRILGTLSVVLEEQHGK